jgi:4-hydroxymandelate oxidase
MQTAQSLPVNLFEMERLAQEKLAQPAFDYYISGANDEITVRENHAAYERIQLAPRMLIDVSQRDMSTIVRLPFSAWLIRTAKLPPRAPREKPAQS